MRVEQNAIDEHIARDLEVGAVANLLGEIDDAGVLTHAVDDVDRISADAARIRPVEILDHGETLCHCRIDEATQRRRQLVVLAGSDRERPRPSVVGVVAIGCVLHLLVCREDLFDRPVIKAVSLPVSYVAWPRAHRDGGVVGRAAAERLAARGIELRGGSSTAGREAPLVLGVARHVRGVSEVVGIAIDAVGRACLEQQDRAGRIFAQATSQDPAR